jgi:hypothetical protein
MAFISMLRERAAKVAIVATPLQRRQPHWHDIITRLRGRTTKAGEEWLTAREVYDALLIPEPARASVSRKVAALMRTHGWLARMVGPPHLRQRGYARMLTDHED